MACADGGIAVPEHAARQCRGDNRSNTTFRPNPVTGTLLSEDDTGVEAPHRCVLERALIGRRWR